jgi:hypothetical protein
VHLQAPLESLGSAQSASSSFSSSAKVLMHCCPLPPNCRTLSVATNRVSLPVPDIKSNYNDSSISSKDEKEQHSSNSNSNSGREERDLFGDDFESSSNNNSSNNSSNANANATKSETKTEETSEIDEFALAMEDAFAQVDQVEVCCCF